ncbi:glucose-6-phosphate dehydrogenase [Marinobacterium arenosum]|uniref:glucose-6-phosphate dehydrogenase n=1 Tax=Marinobacterium arenosum TaxID=2862496 RepID=UPI001C96688B|nr:glucose-6-phosphate dehydrogenase [Marinobacterium arenosum]MBY4677067.1 glucose-6-phosphate dehydrogenase [Marinobacterium arenosum]
MAPADSSSDIVFFGVLGDLAQRKLLPAIYQLERAGLLPDDCRILGLARTALDDGGFRDICAASLQRFVPEAELDTACSARFLQRLSFLQLDFNDPAGFKALASRLDHKRHCIFYYATPASLYGPISQALAEANCLHERCRVVLEKPIGHDRPSSAEVNDQVAGFFDESQIYRIDHYLGKETVQNLIALRFANPIFSSQWNSRHISHVEITVAEKVGIEGRWGYFDDAGQLRDMVQNHLLQLLTLTAMDPPASLDADAVRDAKVALLKSLKPLEGALLNTHVVRGQYSAGEIDNQPVPGYLEEDGANTASRTESFVALKVEIDNPRWQDTPFFLRTGKRLPAKCSQIVVHFKPQPDALFAADPVAGDNRLIIRIQPNEGIALNLFSKHQGLDRDMALRNDPMQLNFAEAFGSRRIADAYERLLLEVIHGNQSLFVRRDEIEHAWQWCDRLLAHWQQQPNPPEPYPAGSWGPDSADKLIAEQGWSRHESE